MECREHPNDIEVAVAQRAEHTPVPDRIRILVAPDDLLDGG